MKGRYQAQENQENVLSQPVLSFCCCCRNCHKEPIY